MLMFFSSVRVDNVTYANMSESTKDFYSTISFVRLYVVPLVISLGIFGNVFAGWVLLKTKWSNYSCAPYMLGLTINDTLFLLSMSVVWLQDATGYPLLVKGQGAVCHAITYVTGTTSLLCVWFTVGVNVDRFIMAFFQSKKRSMCTTFRSKIVVISMSIVATVVYLNLTPISGVVKTPLGTNCGALLDYIPTHQRLDVVDMVLNMLVPYSTLIILCLAITKRVICFYRNRKQFIRMDKKNTLTELQHWPKLERGATKLILVSTIAFLLLTTPTHVKHIWLILLHLFSQRIAVNYQHFYITDLIRHIYFMRYAVNFYIYFAFSKGFRAACKDALPSFCKFSVKRNVLSTRLASTATNSNYSAVEVESNAVSSSVVVTKL